MTILHDSQIYQNHLTLSDGDSQYSIYATCVDLLGCENLDNRHLTLLSHIRTNHKKAYSDAVESLRCEAMNI